MGHPLRSDDPGGLPRWAGRRGRLLSALLLPLSLLLQRLAQAHPDWVERHYSNGLYPELHRLHSAVFAWLPFSASEVLLGAVLVWGARRAWVAIAALRRGEGRAIACCVGALTTILGGAGWAAIWFLLSWGLNYSRPPLEQRLGWNVDDIEEDELRWVCETLISRVNALRADLPEDEQGVMTLADGQAAALDRSGLGFGRGAAAFGLLDGIPRRPKAAFFSPLMSRIGISGIYSPFTGEAHVNVEVTDSELPFTAAHEMAHGLGYAREDEANFIAYLACFGHPDAAFRYSGTLGALNYALAALRDSGGTEDLLHCLELLGDGVRRDLVRSAERIAAMHSKLTEVSSRVNDSYLRSQGEAHGTASYGRVVRLLIGERRQFFIRIREAGLFCGDL